MRSIYLVYCLPVILIAIATIIKGYAFSSFGARTPVMLYLLVIFGCVFLINIQSAIVAAITAVLFSVWIVLHPAFYEAIPHNPFSVTVIYGLSFLMISICGLIYMRFDTLRKEKEGYLRFILDSVPNKIYTSNAKGEATYYNKEWYKYTGFRKFEELKSNIWKLIPAEEVKQMKSQYPAYLSSNRPYEIEHRLKDANGELRWHITRVVPLINKGGKAIAWVGSCTDIDHHKRAEAVKDEFMSIASHELKTPLTSSKAYLQIAMKQLDKEDRVYHFLEQSLYQLDRLQHLIADLLDITKINAGKLNYTISSFDFNDLLINSIASLQQTISTHEIQIAESVSIEIKGDYQRLEQVLNNLISNAVKYSPNSSLVVVRSRIEEGFLLVSVQDFGIGIAGEHLSRLFERFYRIEDTAIRFQGMGLGLFIVSEILSRHKGKFWVESTPGKGSTFYFSLPVVSEKKALL